MTTPVSSVNLEYYFPDKIVNPHQLKMGDVFCFSTDEKFLHLNGKEFCFEVADLFQVTKEAVDKGSNRHIVSFQRLSSEGIPAGQYPSYIVESNRSLRVFKPLTEEERNNIKITKVINKIKELNKRYDERKLRSEKGKVPQVQPNW